MKFISSTHISALLSIVLLSCDPPPSQQESGPKYQVRTLAFYNVENLFDTRNDSLTDDDERTPESPLQWTRDRYEKKLQHIARVLAEIGRDEARRLPDLIGLCEVENRQVLEDLIRQAPLRDGGYGIVHEDSPDHRGIDVALLYRRSQFIVLEQQFRELKLRTRENRHRKTRDQLIVSGLLNGEPLYLAVNHWPSRSGGQGSTELYRMQAAALQRAILDSLLKFDPKARFISMGDYNDNPDDPSLRYGLGTREFRDSLPAWLTYNPMGAFYKKGAGTLAYRDQWSLFDQVLFNGCWFEGDGGYKFWKAGIYNPDYLKTPEGPFKGYPYRTYAGGNYLGGFSDHFPVYALLIRPIPER
ncbi:Endonuclease/Exonuclease/phosphatase family protein [Robiginitalea myxolifaciens]|uniref:Endonuclease/Exonuclease/phosphatase family protein n=1 Tax=Robiginitalea myxolifaciens TaxID=400055 RepID=A0A1I6G6P0_9FLAO|nr:endonuclease/exonuclease/phosphatase family protein [Robiginitalea myxolifaciens]SFR37855.1 Endonuclease/Exonuclease/phosphatase family protein [Robiginitalea myxolifaciens]